MGDNARPKRSDFGKTDYGLRKYKIALAKWRASRPARAAVPKRVKTTTVSKPKKAEEPKVERGPVEKIQLKNKVVRGDSAEGMAYKRKFSKKMKKR